MRGWLETLVLILFVMAAPIQAASSLVVDPRLPRVLASPYLSFYEDASTGMDIAAILAKLRAGQFQTQTAEIPSFGLSKSAYWFAFTAENQHPGQARWFVTVEYPNLDWLDTYFILPDGRMIEQHSGDRRNFSTRPLRSRYFSAELPFASDAESILVLMRVQVSGSLVMPAFVSELTQILDEEARTQVLFGLILGGILSMGLYFVLIGMHAKNLEHVYLGLYFAALALYRVTYHGLTSVYIFPNSPSLANGAVPVTSSAAILFCGLYCGRFLEIRRLPRAYVIYRIWTLFMSVIHIASYFLEYKIVPVILSIGVFAPFLCIWLGVYSWRQGFQPSRLFIVGWSFPLLSVVFFNLNNFGVVERTFLADHIVDLANLGLVLCLSFAASEKINRMNHAIKEAVKEKLHALSQLQKVVYPHQMEQIKAGDELENTMPTDLGHACVLSFDIIGSSKVKHMRSKEFFRNVFARCNSIMSEGYDGRTLKANAYRIKEMGDGFLCSVGYPFQAMSVNPANDAIDLAKRFTRVLWEESQILHLETPIACGIGIAIDSLTGFYPETGTKEYDLYGHGIVLATRYEAMRKTLFADVKGRSVLIVQEVVFQSLDPSHRLGFIPINLADNNLIVRDDPAAVRLYYQYLPGASLPPEKPV